MSFSSDSPVTCGEDNAEQEIDDAVGIWETNNNTVYINWPING